MWFKVKERNLWVPATAMGSDGKSTTFRSDDKLVCTEEEEGGGGRGGRRGERDDARGDVVRDWKGDGERERMGLDNGFPSSIPATPPTHFCVDVRDLFADCLFFGLGAG